MDEKIDRILLFCSIEETAKHFVINLSDFPSLTVTISYLSVLDKFI